MEVLNVTDHLLLEYCIDETFNPQCGSGELILMHSALYGRMRVGRCLPMDLGYMGCQGGCPGTVRSGMYWQG